MIAYTEAHGPDEFAVYLQYDQIWLTLESGGPNPAIRNSTERAPLLVVTRDRKLMVEISDALHKVAAALDARCEHTTSVFGWPNRRDRPPASKDSDQP